MAEIILNEVYFMPETLEPGILYVSEEFEIAGHLCACGCGNRIMTPIDPTEWTFSKINGKPTLYPSIGNWQLPCRSHYNIINGQIKWSNNWSEDEVRAGDKREKRRREKYYSKKGKKESLLKKIYDWVRHLI